MTSGELLPRKYITRDAVDEAHKSIANRVSLREKSLIASIPTNEA